MDQTSMLRGYTALKDKFSGHHRWQLEISEYRHTDQDYMWRGTSRWSELVIVLIRQMTCKSDFYYYAQVPYSCDYSLSKYGIIVLFKKETEIYLSIPGWF